MGKRSVKARWRRGREGRKYDAKWRPEDFVREKGFALVIDVLLVSQQFTRSIEEPQK